MIPAIAPDWTNHNAADPGITLVELLAYLTEILIYRTNQIADPQLAVFVSLLTGGPAVENRPLADQIRDAVLEIRRNPGAVTAGDYERLALACAHGQLARAYCLPGYNLTLRGENRQRPGHISITVVPRSKERKPIPSPELLKTVRDGLEEYRLVTTFLHIVGPSYVPVRIKPTLMLTRDAHAPKVRSAVLSALQRFFALTPERGQDGLPISEDNPDGWPFGKDVYASELYDLIERQPGVDYVETFELSTDDQSRVTRNENGQVMRVDLRQNELPLAEIQDPRGKLPDQAADEGSVNAW